jgi:hypothetical protein
MQQFLEQYRCATDFLPTSIFKADGFRRFAMTELTPFTNLGAERRHRLRWCGGAAISHLIYLISLQSDVLQRELWVNIYTRPVQPEFVLVMPNTHDISWLSWLQECDVGGRCCSKIQQHSHIKPNDWFRSGVPPFRVCIFVAQSWGNLSEISGKVL